MKLTVLFAHTTEVGCYDSFYAGHFVQSLQSPLLIACMNYNLVALGDQCILPPTAQVRPPSEVISSA